MTKQVNNNNGLGFLSLLTIVFITLRLTNHIDWSWWYVLAPIWIPTVLVMTIVALVMIMKK